MAHLEQSRRQIYEAVDLPALHPLPEKPYVYVQHKVARVNIDYHVEYEKHFYSVPHTLIHEEVRVSATEKLVQIFHRSQTDPVAIHLHSNSPGRHSTCKEHMPTRHQKAGEWNPERFLNWAQQIGPHATGFVQAALNGRKHPEQAYRTCLGVLGLARKHGNEHLEEACRQALHARQISYRDVKDILDHLPNPAPNSPTPPEHPNLRGSKYYH